MKALDVEAPQGLFDSGSSIQFLPLWHMTPDEKRTLFKTLADEGVEVLSSSGSEDLETGALAAYKPGMTGRISREIALQLEEIMNGPSVPAVGGQGGAAAWISPVARLSINVEVLKKLPLQIPWQTALQAELVGNENSGDMESLKDAVADALENNSELAAFMFSSDIRKYDVDISRSGFLPDLDAYVQGVTIDEDRAEGALSPYQYEASAGLKFQQILWSDAAMTDYRIKKLLSASQDRQVVSARQNTILDVSEAYYEAARSASAVRIRRDSVSRTRAYLDRARLLEQIGEESLADVYRFESQLAQDNRALIDAVTQARMSILELQRLRGIPSGELLSPGPVFSGEDEDSSSPAVYVMSLASTPRGSSRLEKFVIDSALRRSSDLDSRKLEVEARTAEYKMRRRSFFSPNVTLVGELEYTFYEGGAGESEPVTLYPGVTFDPGSLDSSDSNDWAAGINVSIPLYTGNERAAVVKQSQTLLNQAMANKKAAYEYVEQQARMATASLVASWSKLEQSRKAENAAWKSLAMVEDAYDQGAASSFELLDVQSNLSIAAEQTANARAEFRTSWARLLRITDYGEALVLPGAMESFIEELDAFFE